MMYQAGGHQLIKTDGDCIIKATKLSEVEFYLEHMNKDSLLYDFAPKLYGYGLIDTIKEIFSDTEYNTIIEKEYTHYIKLENIIKSVDNAHIIIDIKLGSIHWVSTTGLNKVDECKKRNAKSTTLVHKFRLDGYISNNIIYHKEMCRNMDISAIKTLINSIGDKNIKKLYDWINQLITALNKTYVNMYGPSILIVVNTITDDMSIKLIDFTVHEKMNIDSARFDDIIDSLYSILQSVYKKQL